MICPECGAELGGEDPACSRCGQTFPAGPQQPGDDSSRPAGGTQSGLPANVAGLLTYVFGWITGIIFLVIEKENRFVRFHAWQSILAFGCVTVIYILLNILFSLGLWRLLFIFNALYTLVGLGSFILWLILMVKAYQRQRYKLPWVGGLAERYAGQ